MTFYNHLFREGALQLLSKFGMSGMVVILQGALMMHE
jgi:hypothetical protein